MLKAFVDASLLRSGVFCVAGLAFGLDRAKKAHKEWVALYGHRHGHMTDLHARRGEFEGISDDEADRLCRGSVRIINKYASYIVTVACDISEVVESLPTEATPDSKWILDVYKNFYPVCAHWALTSIGNFAGRKPGGIAYWFELGDEDQGAVMRFLSDIRTPAKRPLLDNYAFSSATFSPADDVRLFETADFAAWEWAKQIERQRNGLPTRPSLIALMSDQPCMVAGKPYCKTASRYAVHYSGEPLTKYMDASRRILAATSVEELRAIVAEPWE